MDNSKTPLFPKWPSVAKIAMVRAPLMRDNLDRMPEFLRQSATGMRSMLTMDPPDHTRVRKLVNKAFTGTLAHRHDERATRTALEHRVEGARPQHQRGGQVEQVGDLLDRRRRDVTVLVLREVEQRQRGRRGVMVEPHVDAAVGA